MKFYHKIRTKLLVGFTLVALIPALSVGLYSINISSNSLLERAMNSQQEVIAGHRRAIETFLSSVVGDVKFLAASAPMQKLLSLSKADPSWKKARADMEREFLAFAQNRKIYYQVRFLDETGQEIVRVDTNRQGSIIVPQNRLQNKSTRYYFKDVVDLPSGHLFVSPLDLNQERGSIEVPYKPVIRYATPVAYPNGGKAGIVLTNIYADFFLEPLSDVMLVGPDGYFFAHPDGNKKWGSQRDLDHQADIRQEFGHKIARIMTGKGAFLTTKEYAVSYLPVPVPGADFNWILIAQQPITMLLESVRNFQLMFYIILGISLLVALFIALFLDYQITRPIEFLTIRAEEVSMGELHNEIVLQNKSEIGLLAESFERMRISIARMMERLQRG